MFDLLGGGCGGDGRGLGRLDDDGQVEDFFVAVGVWGGFVDGSTGRNVESAVRVAAWEGSC
jgi:hypothetical protein